MSGNDERLDVLVVEDQRSQAESIGAALARFGGFRVRLSGSAGAALAALEAELPAVALLDVGLGDGDGDGVDLAREARARWPDLRICMLTGQDDPATTARAIAAGASGYILKTETPEAVVAAVRRVAAGEVTISLSALPALVSSLRSASRAEDEARRVAQALTSAEAETLRSLARGHTSAVIARELGVTVAAVRGRLRGLYAKLGVSSRLQAVARARDLGLHRSL